MSSSREDRVIHNEAAFRSANERTRRHQAAPDGPTEQLCECGNRDCFERVYLTGAEYEAVRADPMYFAVAPGHEKPDLERVVEERAGYFVVKKDEEVRETAEETDPRRDA